MGLGTHDEHIGLFAPGAPLFCLTGGRFEVVSAILAPNIRLRYQRTRNTHYVDASVSNRKLG